MKHNKKRKILCLVFIIPLMILALGGVVMFLWNMILPEVLGVQEVNFWQALGILILSKILFGGIHNRIGGKMQRWKEQNGHCRGPLDGYTEAEKEMFKEKFKEKFPNFCNKK